MTEKKPAEQEKTSKASQLPFNDDEATISLEFPIALGNGEQVIDQITIRKPRAGEMRGLSMFEVMHLDTDTVLKLLPRITTPIIHKLIADELDPCDLATIGKCMNAFFSGKKQRAELLAEITAKG